MPDSVVDGISLGDDDQNDRNKDSTPEERDGRKDIASKDQKQVASIRSASADKSDTVNETDVTTSREEARPVSESEPSGSDFPKEQAPKDTEEQAVSASHTELKEPMKDEDMIPISENKGADALVISNSITEKENLAGTNFIFGLFSSLQERLI